MFISSNLRLNTTSVDRTIFPERGRNYNREKSNGNWLLITISCHVSSPVKIEDLIHVIKHPGTTLPEPPSSGDFVKRLEVALDEEKANGENDKLNLGRFKKVVLATAKAKPKPKGVADQNIVKAWPWVLAVWVR